MTAKAFCSFLLTLVLGLTGCGYTLQGTHSHELEKEGVRKVYVAPVRNDTYKAGIENVVYNALLQSLASYNGVHLVSEPEDADAVLSAIVTRADTEVAATGAASGLSPNTIGSALSSILPPYGSVYVATYYNAVLGVSFSLNKRHIESGKRANIWSGAFNRSQLFPASNQLGSLGTTSMLINNSEYDRAIRSVSKDMMSDVREAMLARF
ncbi:MAG: LPS assembly lipoprotein LptE [Oligoflexia bacterium]|nr:LPS assembly lipoprotein LptE [Oligoflexia bacterium]